MRFATPKQSSLILGTSRAAQALQPQVIDTILERKDIFNYAFTIIQSPYGPAYLRSIESKIKVDTKNGIYIVTVDPWCICNRSQYPNDSTRFNELNFAVAKTTNTSLNPNIYYILHSYDKPLYTLLLPTEKDKFFLHKNGWLDVHVPMDSTSVAERTAEKINDYKINVLPKNTFSQVRWVYLIKTIQFLVRHGNVYLVRLPTSDKMFQIENEFMPDFNERIINLAESMKVKYKDLTPERNRYQYIDGDHLYKVSGRQVSIEIGNWIKNIQ